MWCILLALCAQPSLRLPATITGAPGAFIAVRADTTGAVVRYVALDAGLNVFPAQLLADTKATVVTSVTPGKYRLLAYTATGDLPSEPVIVTIVIGEGVAPVIPPTQLETDLKALWQACTDADRVAQRDKLAGLYRRVAALCEDSTLVTAGDLYAAAKALADATLPAHALNTIRNRAADAVRSIVPVDPTTQLTPTIRAGAAEIYKTMAIILEKLP
jgi:hypothetical protein